MKRFFTSLLFCFPVVWLCFAIGCKKNSKPATDIGTRVSFTEEFEDVYQLEPKGWVFKDLSSSPANWGQGQLSFDKGGRWLGFEAYSFTTFQTEYAYVYPADFSSSVSSWLITPVLSVKTGDKISFYTRGDTISSYKSRMQVLMNALASANVGNKLPSVGDFKTTLIDINPNHDWNVYPITWQKYEYTFNNINGRTDTRIAFRYLNLNGNSPGGIGIDQFRFEVK